MVQTTQEEEEEEFIPEPTAPPSRLRDRLKPKLNETSDTIEPPQKIPPIQQQEESLIDKISESINANNIPQFVDSCKVIKFGDNETWKNVVAIIMDKVQEEKFPGYVSLCSKLSLEIVPCLGLRDLGDLITDIYLESFFQFSKTAEIEKDAACAIFSKAKFISELSKKDLIPKMSLISLIDAFLPAPIKTQTVFNKIDHIKIEIGCIILTTAGKLLDLNPEFQPLVVQNFEALSYLSHCKEIPPRLRFMAQDLNELKENKWLPRALSKKKSESSEPTKANGKPEEPSLPSDVIKAIEDILLKMKVDENNSLSGGILMMKTMIKMMNPQQMDMLIQAVQSEIPAFQNTHTVALGSSLDTWMVPRNNARRASLCNRSPPMSPMSAHKYSPPLTPSLPSVLSYTLKYEDLALSLVFKGDRTTVESTELLIFILRKLAENSIDFPICLALITRLIDFDQMVPQKISNGTLVNGTGNKKSFTQILETCLIDEGVLRMFVSSNCLKTYFKLLKELHKKVSLDISTLRICFGNIQRGLYELKDDEVDLYNDIEKICDSCFSPGIPPLSLST
eukprot:TRINITY_DN4043_c0_g1_i2.p1 TRINITY_DN4043_c0_g1~~TRINITY_DN4043_c0_g1_i2.p1  ORF type:complete len:564 (-),score=113.58 TRINITY_DN4043_c0_g1_i2:177-1868(-)